MIYDFSGETFLLIKIICYGPLNLVNIMIQPGVHPLPLKNVHSVWCIELQKKNYGKNKWQLNWKPLTFWIKRKTNFSFSKKILFWALRGWIFKKYILVNTYGLTVITMQNFSFLGLTVSEILWSVRQSANGI